MIKLDNRFKIIFSGITGSHLYGTSLPESDRDVRGIFIPTEEFYLGFLEKVEQVESHEPDETYWEISKFFKLCLDNNPNILELLFIPDSFVLETTPEWQEIIKYRDMFLSTKCKHTFSGYAVSQLHRIKQHREWLLNPPKKQPERKDFGLPNTNIIHRDQINAFNELLHSETPIELSDNALEILQREKAYINASKYWTQYQEWGRNRNPARASLELKYGFDCKHAGHLVRLIGEGRELLQTGFITFPRPNAKELLAIRQGKYSYKELMELIGGEENGIDNQLSSIDSGLPHNPDRKSADILCRQLIKQRISLR
jgi:predicted nucleotidyltransferase